MNVLQKYTKVRTKKRIWVRKGLACILSVVFMAEIDVIRELHCYEKMFDHILRTVKECEEICKDPVVTKS